MADEVDDTNDERLDRWGREMAEPEPAKEDNSLDEYLSFLEGRISRASTLAKAALAIGAGVGILTALQGRLIFQIAQVIKEATGNASVPVTVSESRQAGSQDSASVSDAPTVTTERIVTETLGDVLPPHDPGEREASKAVQEMLLQPDDVQLSFDDGLA